MCSPSPPCLFQLHLIYSLYWLCLYHLLLEATLPKLYTKKSIFKTLANYCASIQTMLRCLIAWFDIIYYEIIKGCNGEESINHRSRNCIPNRLFFFPLIRDKYHCLLFSKSKKKTKKKELRKLKLIFPVTPINFTPFLTKFAVAWLRSSTIKRLLSAGEIESLLLL